MPFDLALAIEALVPAAQYEGSCTANDRAAFDAIRWVDDRPQPTWDDVVAAAPVSRRLVPKSVVIARLTDQQLASADAIFQQQPRLKARWYAADHPAVYADDPDALALLKAVGADFAVVMAP